MFIWPQIKCGTLSVVLSQCPDVKHRGIRTTFKRVPIPDCAFFPSAAPLYQTEFYHFTPTAEHWELVDDFHGSAVPSEEEPVLLSDELKPKNLNTMCVGVIACGPPLSQTTVWWSLPRTCWERCTTISPAQSGNCGRPRSSEPPRPHLPPPERHRKTQRILRIRKD